MANEVAVGAGSGAVAGVGVGTAIMPGWGTVIGGVAGGAIGGLGGYAQMQKRLSDDRALAGQRAAIKREVGRRQKTVGSVRKTFGDLWSMEKDRRGDIAGATKRHGELAGAVENEASAVRDFGTLDTAQGASSAAAGVRGASLNRGLLGSSLNQSAREQLLAGYAGGLGNVAAATEDSRQGSWDALKDRQLGMEGLATPGADIGNLLRSSEAASAIAGARKQIPVTYFGNLLNTGIGVADAGARAEAQGGVGLRALMPGLGAKKTAVGNTASGATTSGGRP